jgi:uncharacterized protein
MLPLGLPEAVNDFSHMLMSDEPLRSINSLMNCLRKIKPAGAEEELGRLLSFSGFPEPFIKSSPRFYNRWSAEYKSLLTREEIRDLSRIADIKGVEQLIELLPSKVGSLLSINSIAEDIGSHHATIVRWLNILKAIYLIFTLRPWHKNIARSIKKENKLYFYDWSSLSESGIRFENLLAVSLMKMASRLSEIGLGSFEIMHIRNKEKQEVDFVLVKNGKPIALFEAKESDTDISRTGLYFGKRLSVPFFQIVRSCRKAEMFPGDCAVIPAISFLMMTG